MAPSQRSSTSRGTAIPGWVWQDSQWASAVHVLLAQCIRHKALRFVDFEGASIDWERLTQAAGPWSHGERLLVKVAANLWGGRAPVNLRELLVTLDDCNFARVMQAIRLFRGVRRGIPG